MIAAMPNSTPRRRCTRSRSTSAAPIISTPDGAIRPGATGTQAWSVGRADRPDMADHPVGRRNGQAEQDQKNRAFDILLLFDVDSCLRRLMNFAKPCARNWQAGHSPQP